MGVMDRANSRIPSTGDYLDKEDLIRLQEPMGITSVVWDERGSGFGSRWVVSVIPWFEGQDEPQGLVTFTANPTRNPVFEDLQVQLEENGNEPIGPIVVLKGKSQKGYRFFTFGDWKEGGVTEPAPEPTKPAPPAPRAARPAASAPAPAPTPATPVSEASEPKRGRGRPRKEDAAATTPVSAPSTASVKPPESPVAGISQALAVGSAVCPNCNQTVTGRVLPDEHGNRFIIHPHCPQTNKAEILPVTEEV